MFTRKKVNFAAKIFVISCYVRSLQEHFRAKFVSAKFSSANFFPAKFLALPVDAQDEEAFGHAGGGRDPAVGRPAVDQEVKMTFFT
jgi:hypothetical protein